MLTRRPFFFNNTFNNTKTHNNMAQTATCPEIKDYSAEDLCLEQMPGMGMNIYPFKKGDLKAPLKPTGNKYPTLSTDSFLSGKGLYKWVAKDGTVGQDGEGQGQNKGFKITFGFEFEAQDEKSAELARSAQNLDLGYIAKYGSKWRVIYDPDHKVQFASGGIKCSTGKKSGDENSFSFEASLEGLTYPYYEIEEPEGGWDSLLASKNV